ncbi:hypothetical protein [Stenotrophomonas sp. NPDC078853]|uniref:hypothetical protein n=1 Tax=Stenotrophomonas sp. NPDC078853 TaxID=3364534 RepID=UPI00384DB4C5
MSHSIKEQMRHWGHYQEHRFVSPLQAEEALAMDTHPLARAQQFARGTKVTREPVERDGLARRLLMGAAAGLVDGHGGYRPVSKEFVDHIPCVETRSHAPRSATAAVMTGSPDEYRWIDRALSDLYRQNMIRALVVMEEFIGRGGQAARAEAVARKAGVPLTKWQYRKELEKGMAFMEGKRS